MGHTKQVSWCLILVIMVWWNAGNYPNNSAWGPGVTDSRGLDVGDCALSPRGSLVEPELVDVRLAFGAPLWSKAIASFNLDSVEITKPIKNVTHICDISYHVKKSNPISCNVFYNDNDPLMALCNWDIGNGSPQGSCSGGKAKFSNFSIVHWAESNSASLWARSAALASACFPASDGAMGNPFNSVSWDVFLWSQCVAAGTSKQLPNEKSISSKNAGFWGFRGSRFLNGVHAF